MQLAEQEENGDLEKHKCPNICSCYHLISFRILLKKNMLKNYTVNIPATYSHMRVLRIGASCINPVILISCSYTLKLLGIQTYSLAVVIHSNS